MVSSIVKRRSTMNIGTLRPPVPTRPATVLPQWTRASGMSEMRVAWLKGAVEMEKQVIVLKAIWPRQSVIGKLKP